MPGQLESSRHADELGRAIADGQIADYGQQRSRRAERPDRSEWRVLARRCQASPEEYKADDLQDRAAALTYFGIQSIFPGLLVLVSLLGVLGKSATQPLITNLGKAAPPSVRKIIMSDVTHLQHSHAASGILGIAGIALALWSASNYVAAFMRASNIIYDVPEGRPIWKTAPIRLGVTVVTMILLQPLQQGLRALSLALPAGSSLGACRHEIDQLDHLRPKRTKASSFAGSNGWVTHTMPPSA
jgi:membrane protein